MKEYRILFKQNGDEYTGYLDVRCNKIKKVGSATFKADDVEVTIDENIISIEEVKGK